MKDAFRTINNLEREDLNCNIFSVYDYDGLTIQELLCQFFTKINQCIDVSNKTVELAKWLVNEGLSQEVAKKLEEWYQNGKLAEIINETIFNELNNKINTNTSNIAQNLEKINQNIIDIEPFKNTICVINDTMSIEKINELLRGQWGTYIFKNGNYRVTPETPIKIAGNNKDIYFETSAKIIQMTPNSGKYVMVEVRKADRVRIHNIIIDGEMPLNSNADYATEWGYGIEVSQSSNITIISPTIRNTTGDGIYVGYKWDEEPNPTTIENITVLNPYIHDVSRNGISLCSGNNILVEGGRIINVRRKFPQSGIDIEPENGDDSKRHLNNVQIRNVYTENCDVGIITANNMTVEQNVRITNHTSRKCTANLYVAEWQPQGLLTYENSRAIETNRNGIIISKKHNRGKLLIDNFTVEKMKDDVNLGDTEQNSCIYLDAGSNQSLGNIVINNISILHSNYAYSIGSVGTTVYSDVKINGIKGIGSAPTLRIGRLLEPKVTNCDTKYDTNYGELNYTDYNVPTDMYISQGLQAPTTRNIYHSLPDGVYKIGTNRVNSQTLTVNFTDGLTVLGKGKNSFVSNNDGPYMEFKKLGKDIMILNMQNMQ